MQKFNLIILSGIFTMFMLTGCMNNKNKDHSNSIDMTEPVNDSITSMDQIIGLSTDTIPLGIAATIENNNTTYITKENFKRIVFNLRQKIVVKGVYINDRSGEKFILKPSDVYLKYDRRGTGLNGNVLSGRDDFDKLPTKEEAEAITSNYDAIQELLQMGGMTPMKGKYWTKTKVHDEYENVLNYSSFWFYGKNKTPYVNTQQTINDAHLRLVERINNNKANSSARNSESIAPADSEQYELFEGSIGPYPIKMWYSLSNGYLDESATKSAVTGKYTYTTQGTTLELSGIEYKSGYIILDERSAKGVNSGTFELYRNFDGQYDITGTFTNLRNNKKFDVKLKSAN